MKYSLSIKFLWADMSLSERARLAASHGFDCVELWDWRGEDMEGLAEACRSSRIEIAGFFGHSVGGLCDPTQRDELLEALSESVAMAKRVGAWQLHLFSNALAPGGMGFAPAPPLTQGRLRRSCVDGLRECLQLVDGTSIELTLEAINPVYCPTYFLCEFGASLEIVREIDHPQLRVFFDAYHQQLAGGRLIDNLIDGLPWVASFHVADVPRRRAPGTGEINFRSLKRVLDEHGYDRQVTFELAEDEDADAAISACKDVFPF